MEPFFQLGIEGIDHVEFAVADLENASQLYTRLGFERIGTREITERKLRSFLFGQGQVRILVSQSALPTDPVAKYVTTHGDGIMAIAFACENVVTALETTLARGADLQIAPKRSQRDNGFVEKASIRAMGDVIHTFIQRAGDYFDEGFEAPVPNAPVGFGTQAIDHITINVEKGKMKYWSQFYEKVFGLKNTRFFDIHTEKTGLYSFVMESPNSVIKMPINEPTEAESQIQEFLNINHGAGVQHLALSTCNLIETLTQLRRSGVSFLEVPDTYYDEVPRRVPDLTESLSDLRSLGILADGDATGYLLQIFSQNVVGPFFYEFIQRKGNNGFGEGNFRALFEAIERDQIQRGLLKVQ